jgi:UDP-N-acetylmuramoylalanine--D-glutamate ligase
MYTRIIEDIKDKNILILGFGVEGKSTYNFIRKFLPEKHITIADTNTTLIENNSFLKDDNNISFALGEDYLKCINDYDCVIKSPGVCIKDVSISNIKSITSQVDLFLKYYSKNTIGITGTKGKSTTSSMLYQCLVDSGYKAKLLGNIGTSIFEYITEINEDTTTVLELSSDQLTYANYSPHISVWLNVFEEHLDHYLSYQDYINAKANIYKYQSIDDYFIYNEDNLDVVKNIVDAKANTYSFSITNSNPKKNKYTYLDNDYIYMNNNNNNNTLKLYDTNLPRKLPGKHNINNIMAVLTVSHILKLDIDIVSNSINNFSPLPHRIEFIGNYNGVDYYDDSISTIPESCIGAIETVTNIDTIIIGGKDRGIDYSKLIDYLNNRKVPNIICMPDTGNIVAEKLIGCHFIKVANLEEAVREAVRVTKKGSACVLSPAASSYGFFKNYIERGNEFKRLIEELN